MSYAQLPDENPSEGGQPPAPRPSRNALGNEIWFDGALWGYLPSTVTGMYAYFAFVLASSLWAGLVGLLAQFGIVRGAWIAGLLAPVTVGAAAFWGFAHRHSPSAGPRRQSLPR